MKNKLLIGLVFCVLLCLLASCAPQTEVSDPAVSVENSGETASTVESSEPEASEPEISEPDVSEPEVSEPEASEPEVSEPEVSEPEVSEPDVSEPEISEPEVSEPEVSEPEVSEPEEIFVAEIEITSSKKDLYPGETATLTATVKPNNADNKAVTWSIQSGSSYATISSGGVLTAKAAGTVVVKATAKDGSGVSATYTITVKPILVSSITISGDKEVKVGGKITLSATVKPDNAGNKAVTWSISSGSSYASISADGVLTAKAAGTVTVKATAKDGSGVSATYTVTVKSDALWSGSGTERDPYLITCLEDLMNLQKVLDKKGYYFKQIADIDCGSVALWAPIGSEQKPFRHNYDGGNFEISNLHLTNDTYFIGLFGYSRGVAFKNINISGATMDNTDSCYGDLGALCGYAKGCTFTSCAAKVEFLQDNTASAGGLVGKLVITNDQTAVMTDCHTEGKIKSSNAGGLIGISEAEESYYSLGEEPHGVIQHCSSSVEMVNGGLDNIGGLIGMASYTNILNCHATGDVYGEGKYIGGLVGLARDTGEIAYCYATGNVYGNIERKVFSYYAYGSFCGGLIGQMTPYITLRDSYATGDVYSTANWSDCQDDITNNGGIWLKYRNPAGSLVGCIDASSGAQYGVYINLYNCYATGFVYADDICEEELTYCHGALVGLVYDNASRRLIIDTSKSDQSDWSGFSDTAVGRFENNFNLESLRTYYTAMNVLIKKNGVLTTKYSKMPTHDYVEIITEAQLLDQSVFEGWDFENVWVMTEDGPKLR